MLRKLRVEGRKAFLNVPVWVLFALMVLASLAWSNGPFSRLPAVLTAGSGAATTESIVPALIFSGVMVLGTVITCYLLFRRANLD